MRERLFAVLALISKPTVAIGGAVAIAAVVVGGAWYAASRPLGGSTVPVTRGTITEEVDVTGTVKAAQSTDLAFQTSGRVAAIRVAVGDHVFAGQTLVALDGSTQAAAVALAQANLESQQARLDALAAGTRPEQLAIDQTAAAQASNALVNAVQTAYTNADDAVHAKADQLFSNPRNASAQLTIVVPDSVLARRIQQERITLEGVFSSWQTMLSGSATPEQQAVTTEANLKQVATFLNDLTAALAETQPSGSFSAATLSGYQTSVNTGRLNVAASLSAVISADTASKAADGALTLAQAGATTNDLNAQKAAVDAAQAALDSARAVAGQSVIAAPVSGTITAQNANLGETVTPGAPLVSMIADGKYQADARISESDIAKIHLNDVVNVTFAAYPGVTFPAVVTTVDPAAQVTNGVASYGVTVTFTDTDTRLIPGLSANISIVTATKEDVLLAPTSALLTNGNQKLVSVKENGATVQTPVTTGITSASGMTEIVSGLSEGELLQTFSAN